MRPVDHKLTEASFRDLPQIINQCLPVFFFFFFFLQYFLVLQLFK